MAIAPPRVLWLDDDLDSDRASYVQVWRNWFRQANDKGQCRLHTCSSLRQFAAVLAADDPVFDLLVLDVMLKREPSPNFGDIGFADERILPLDAGVQLLGLMRNAGFRNERPGWMQRYVSKPVVLLSSSPNLPTLIGSYLDGNCRGGVHCIVKALDTSVPGQTRPDGAFEQQLNEILRGL